MCRPLLWRTRRSFLQKSSRSLSPKTKPSSENNNKNSSIYSTSEEISAVKVLISHSLSLTQSLLSDVPSYKQPDTPTVPDDGGRGGGWHLMELQSHQRLQVSGGSAHPKRTQRSGMINTMINTMARFLRIDRCNIDIQLSADFYFERKREMDVWSLTGNWVKNGLTSCSTSSPARACSPSRTAWRPWLAGPEADRRLIGCPRPSTCRRSCRSLSRTTSRGSRGGQIFIFNYWRYFFFQQPKTTRH